LRNVFAGFVLVLETSLLGKCLPGFKKISLYRKNESLIEQEIKGKKEHLACFGVATSSRRLKIVGLFCKRAL